MTKKDLIRQCDLDAIRNAVNIIERIQDCHYPDKVIIENYRKAIMRILEQYK